MKRKPPRLVYTTREAAFALGLGRATLEARAKLEPLLAAACRQDGDRVVWIAKRLESWSEQLPAVAS